MNFELLDGEHYPPLSADLNVVFDAVGLRYPLEENFFRESPVGPTVRRPPHVREHFALRLLLPSQRLCTLQHGKKSLIRVPLWRGHADQGLARGGTISKIGTTHCTLVCRFVHNIKVDYFQKRILRGPHLFRVHRDGLVDETRKQGDIIDQRPVFLFEDFKRIFSVLHGQMQNFHAFNVISFAFLFH